MRRFHRDYLFFCVFLYLAMGLFLLGTFGWLAYHGYRGNHLLREDYPMCLGCPEISDAPIFHYEYLAGGVGFILGGVWAGWLWQRVKKADPTTWRAMRGLVVAELLLAPGLILSAFTIVFAVIAGIVVVLYER